MPSDYRDSQDEVINVALPKQDYDVLREMIEKQKSLNWIGKYFRNVLFVAAAGLVSFIAFGDQLKSMVVKIFGF